jgi:competence protein ComGC
MKLKCQILVETLIAIVFISFLTLLVFFIFNVVSKINLISEDAIFVYNKFINYQNILLGLSRENFSQIEDLEYGKNYFLKPTTSGYMIVEGIENEIWKSNQYLIWFEKSSSFYELDNKKMIYIYIQSPNKLYKSNLLLANIKERVFNQNEWLFPTTSILSVNTTSIYYQEIENLTTSDGSIRLSE